MLSLMLTAREIPTEVRTRQSWLLSSLLLNTVLQVLANVVRRKKRGEKLYFSCLGITCELPKII